MGSGEGKVKGQEAALWLKLGRNGEKLRQRAISKTSRIFQKLPSVLGGAGQPSSQHPHICPTQEGRGVARSPLDPRCPSNSRRRPSGRGNARPKPGSSPPQLPCQRCLETRRNYSGSDCASNYNEAKNTQVKHARGYHGDAAPPSTGGARG